MAELVFHRLGEPRLRLPMDRDRFLLGRGSSNHLIIDDEEVASEEAAIELRNEGWWIIDASGRGTRLDETVVVSEAPLFDGAVIHLGKELSATFRLGEPYSPGETRRLAGHTTAREIGSSEAMTIRLGWISPRGEQRLTLEPGETAGIGQEDSNRIELFDEYVSAFHARIFYHKGAWRLSDLGSTNGTFLDGVQIREAILEPGMRIRTGDTEFSVQATVKGRASSGAAGRYGMVTSDPALGAVLDQVARLGQTDATVTIFGESGTGKELVARAVHDASHRAAGPFIPVNCAAISKELIESELFGHEKGAFTGAATARCGAFEEADGGTLFLDEVGELPLDLQAKLLRAIELKEIRRVGSARPLTVDARIVAATNRDLHLEVRAGRFREDLFYRLYVVPLTLPPLRQRKDDVLLLAEHFLTVRSPGPPPVLSEGSKKKLVEHRWPGNVRELRNAIERAILFHDGGRISEEHITFPSGQEPSSTDGVIQAFGKTLAQIEREAIELALAAAGGNRRLSAKALGIARSTLQAKLKELGLLSFDPEEARDQ